VQLNDEVDSESSSATYENGLLSIHLPLAEKASKPVRVTIEPAEEA
jgi:HSP20 family molecular chaperone IbpA